MAKNGRPIDGILLLDKSLDASSNQALQRIKYLFSAKKAGHTGSLDPLATGMLPICFGRATKFADYLLNSNKCYETTAKLGVTTSTGDAEGEVLETTEVPVIDPAALETVLEAFRGEISQVPPMFSALKHQGQPLYKLARQGKSVPREPRTLTIHELRVISIEADEIVFRVRCSKGTYIRTLVEDIGRVLGCGAHVSALRRMSVSPYENQKMHTYDELAILLEARGQAALDALLLPIESTLAHFEPVTITSTDKFYLKLGKQIALETPVTSGFVRMMVGAQCIGLGEMFGNSLEAKKLFA